MHAHTRAHTHAHIHACGLTWVGGCLGTLFEKHIKEEHNMWNYLFFMSYLLEKDDTDYTTNEVIQATTRKCVCVFVCKKRRGRANVCVCLCRVCV
jgi:hypothetical protein